MAYLIMVGSFQIFAFTRYGVAHNGPVTIRCVSSGDGVFKGDIDVVVEIDGR